MCNPNSTALTHRRAALLQQHATNSNLILNSSSSSSSNNHNNTTTSFGSEQLYTAFLKNPTMANGQMPPNAFASLYRLQDVVASVPTTTTTTNNSNSNNNTTSTTSTTAPTVTPVPMNIPNLPPKKPKRRRKPQKPGKTAKQNDRHFVVHNYHDHANDSDDTDVPTSRRRGGVAVSFPQKLHSVLDQVEADGLSHVLSWQPHGRCFVIHQPKEFTDHVMPHYFRQSKLTSFQRQLNLYGFNRITRGQDAGGYYHELFLRGKEFLCKRMVRTKVKGTKFKAASSPDQEPNFYSMPPVVVTPHSSDCETESSVPTLTQVPITTSNTSMLYGALAPMPESLVSTIPTTASGPAPSYQAYPVYLTQAQQQQQQPPVAKVVQSSTASTAASSLGYPYPTGAPVSAPAPVSSAPQPNASNNTSNSDSNDLLEEEDEDVLDEAVDELFLDPSGTRVDVNDSVLDFIQVWDPSSYGEDAALQNDEQLANVLDKMFA
eukprot:Nitzschia sp. Nitz4//scaffold133_size116822//2039//3639//NITZ4_003789-RA/size116822-augustus-gene-0.160-mRNA-1//-1//CDS//3329535342//4326//frame0